MRKLIFDETLPMEDHKHDVQLEHFQNLISVAYADGEITDSEKEILFNLAKELQISKASVQEMIKNAADLDFLIPSNYNDRVKQLTDVLTIALIDGELHDNEYKICLRIANNLKFSKTDLNNTLSLIKTLWS